MPAKRLRFCAECKAKGIEAIFETGNKLRQHKRSFHPVTKAARVANGHKMSAFRRETLIRLTRLIRSK
jgi:hypothetical protein